MLASTAARAGTAAHIAVLAAAVLLAGCGLRGDLYLPDEEPASEETRQHDEDSETGNDEDEEDS